MPTQAATNPAFQKEARVRITNFSIEMEIWELRFLVFMWTVVWKSEVLLGLEALLLCVKRLSLSYEPLLEALSVYIKNVECFVRTAAWSTASVYQERWMFHTNRCLTHCQCVSRTLNVSYEPLLEALPVCIKNVECFVRTTAWSTASVYIKNVECFIRTTAWSIASVYQERWMFRTNHCLKHCQCVSRTLNVLHETAASA